MITVEQAIIAACVLAWGAYRQPRWFLAWLVLFTVFLVVMAVLSLTGVIPLEE